MNGVERPKISTIAILLALIFCVESVASAAVVTYEYDPLHRLTKVIYDDGTSITYEYDAAGNRVSVVVAGVCPPIPADTMQPACPGCADCSCATCEDRRVELCEVIGYACAWMTGCNDNLADMTRAAYLWIVGEFYCWDEAQGNWFPAAFPPPASGCCEPGARGTADPVASPHTLGDRVKKAMRATDFGRHLKKLPSAGSNAARGETGGKPDPVAPAKRRHRLGEPRVRTLPISIPAAPGASVVALECRVPEGWQVLEISDGGVWDGLHRKVKWGPFFGDLPRTVLLQVRSVRGNMNVAGFGATVSVDGVNQSIQLE